MFGSSKAKNDKNEEEEYFKNKYTFEKRQQESSNIIKKFPGKIPVIIQKTKSSRDVDIPNIGKKKFLVPEDLEFCNLLFIVRKRLKLGSEKALYMFVNDTLVPSSKLLNVIYEEEKNEDGFLYVYYASESTFGSFK
jgi:GABA(A) receptor-associated protein